MTGVAQEVFLDQRHVQRHLPDTIPVQQLLRRGRAVHVFNNESTMMRVAQAIIERGKYTGLVRGYDRYGLVFTNAIGYGIDADGSTIPLFYGEVKVDAENRYHAIPRTRPSDG
jgi:hypothetical protein